MNWNLETRDGVDVLTLTGYLRDAAVERFDGAVGWVLARGTGSVVLDLTGLRGWSTEGERAVLGAVERLRACAYPLALCGLAFRSGFAANQATAPAVHPDLATALRHLGGDEI